ncbi:putative GTP pyrophosphokinase, relA [Deinococcus grandis]|uniref:Putative GTP pyrophosphokinase, relA n=1 Tax=Deinococcus grandis TaxID=57498 RepID=A0A100HGZ9_9DEIO|nr:hypothetical protein DEGR_27360 [Deinococcus grandis]GAQ20515.1 putative GTP pyrophosphokinase, relA [Deinococcus grandis]
MFDERGQQTLQGVGVAGQGDGAAFEGRAAAQEFRFDDHAGVTSRGVGAEGNGALFTFDSTLPRKLCKGRN